MEGGSGSESESERGSGSGRRRKGSVDFFVDGMNSNWQVCYLILMGGV